MTSEPLPEPVTQPVTELATADAGSARSIDYAGLVTVLVTPLLETPEALRLDCERSPSRPRVWLRLALDPADRPRVLGRQGRTIQAIRTLVATAAKTVGEMATIEVFGEREAMAGDRSGHGGHDRGDRRERPDQRPDQRHDRRSSPSAGDRHERPERPRREPRPT